MPLWGANSTSANDKPLYLNANGEYYNKADCEGILPSDAAAANGTLTQGWTQFTPVGGLITGVTVTAGGSGYSNGDVTFAKGTGEKGEYATGTAVTNSTGGIVSITVTNPGRGYGANSTVTVPDGTGATLALTTSSLRMRYEPLVALANMG